MRMSSKVFDAAQREQRRIYGATRESAVLPRGWLSSKAPNPESQHEGVLVSLLLSAKMFTARANTPKKGMSRLPRYTTS